MEVPELNTTLIEAYRDLDRTTRAAKDLARRIKTTQQQAKVATELWRAAELKLASLEQQPQQQPPLSLPAPTNEALPVSSPKPSLSATVPSNGDPAHHRVATVEASTMTDSVQTIEAASPVESQPRPKPATPQPKRSPHLSKPPPTHLQRRTGH